MSFWRKHAYFLGVVVVVKGVATLTYVVTEFFLCDCPF
jgi:hypothetical protein